MININLVCCTVPAPEWRYQRYLPTFSYNINIIQNSSSRVFSLFRFLCFLWFPSPRAEEADAVRGAGLPAELHVRHRQLGQLPRQARGGAGQVGEKTISLDNISDMALTNKLQNYLQNASDFLQLILKDNHFRMAMLVTLFLVLINIFNSVRYRTNIVNCNVYGN